MATGTAFSPRSLPSDWPWLRIRHSPLPRVAYPLVSQSARLAGRFRLSPGIRKMLDDRSHFIARAPRHAATGVESLRLTYRRAGGKPDAVEAELIDLSRSGIQFRTGAAMVNGERVSMCIEDVETGFRSEHEAVVRWQRTAPEKRWLTGCQFLAELSWEVLGELFLTEALSRDVLQTNESKQDS
ncbi:MAG: PilZ domain-containing protein [Planctomycetales bacterium]|nr:PilZ domain-containing protein [Planctomycetales bacterium]